MVCLNVLACPLSFVWRMAASETEAVGVLKTEEVRWQKLRASTGYLVIAHLDLQSLFGSSVNLSGHTCSHKILFVCVK